MSTYKALTKNPRTGNYEEATWIDDYFGNHHYGVQFEGEDMVYDVDKTDLPTKERPNTGRTRKVIQTGVLQQEVKITCYICEAQYSSFAGADKWSIVDNYVVKPLCSACSQDIKEYVEFRKSLVSRKFKCPQCGLIMEKIDDHSYKCTEHNLVISIG